MKPGQIIITIVFVLLILAAVLVAMYALFHLGMFIFGAYDYAGLIVAFLVLFLFKAGSGVKIHTKK